MTDNSLSCNSMLPSEQKQRNHIKMVFSLLLLLISLSMVAFFTFQSPEKSASLSENVRKGLIALFHLPLGKEHWYMNPHFFRSLAHFPLYFLLELTLLVISSLLPSLHPKRNAFIFGLTLAIMDETVKIMLPVRHFEAIDLLIDFLAILLALGIFSAVCKIRRVILRQT